jgi:nuclear cap-binding protein subunit 2
MSLSSHSLSTEAELMRLAAKRSAPSQLFSPSLEADVLTSYMAHRRRHYTDEAWVQLVYGMCTSRTLYVGNLAFTTREEQIHELFSRAGRVRRIIMGLNAQTRTPCGFCFVELETKEEAALAQRCLAGTQLEGRVMRADIDQEFEPGRQYGRSKSGGQLQDDARHDFDAGRGGWGVWQQQRQERVEAAQRHFQAQRDTFGTQLLQLQEGDEGFDPTETVERPRDRLDPNRAYKLSAATVAALTEGVFPHYALPIDERIRRALQLLQGEAEKTAAGGQSGAAPAAGPKRSVSPVAEPATTPGSPPSKRARRDLSPVPFAAVSPEHAGAAAASRSPQPAYGSPRPRSPGPRSPRPIATGAAAAAADNGFADESEWSPPPSRGFTPEPHDEPPQRAAARDGLSDEDRTPPPLPDRMEDEQQQQLAHDDATPPPSPPHGPMGGGDRHDDLDDDARTPEPLPDDDDQDAAMRGDDSHAPVDDDEATPPPPTDEQEATGHRRNDQDDADFDEFER